MKMNSSLYRMKYLAAALLAVYCFAFFRADSTQESIVRAVMLEQNGSSWTVGLLYQAPEASADSSEASGEIRFVAVQETTLEKALAAVQKTLPQTPNYRLCDFLLLTPESSWQTLQDYEALVLNQQCGRTAAAVQFCGFSCAELSGESEESETILSSLLETVKAAEELSPRLYELNLTAGLLLPRLIIKDGETSLAEEGAFLTRSGMEEWENEKTELYRLLTGQGGTRHFWPDSHPLTLRRCTVSVTCRKEGEFILRIDCHTAAGQTPDPRYSQWLSEACQKAVAAFWAEGQDVLGLGACQALRQGPQSYLESAKNACPQVRTDVRFTTFL